MRIKTKYRENRNKNWDGGYLYYPFLHSTTVSHYVLHVHSVQWNAGMGNTDTLHPNSCFSIPTSENKIFITSVNIMSGVLHVYMYIASA